MPGQADPTAASSHPRLRHRHHKRLRSAGADIDPVPDDTGEDRGVADDLELWVKELWVKALWVKALLIDPRVDTVLIRLQVTVEVEPLAWWDVQVKHGCNSSPGRPSSRSDVAAARAVAAVMTSSASGIQIMTHSAIGIG